MGENHRMLVTDLATPRHSWERKWGRGGWMQRRGNNLMRIITPAVCRQKWPAGLVAQRKIPPQSVLKQPFFQFLVLDYNEIQIIVHAFLIPPIHSSDSAPFVSTAIGLPFWFERCWRRRALPGGRRRTVALPFKFIVSSLSSESGYSSA
jgi:hypothetical protein